MTGGKGREKERDRERERGLYDGCGKRIGGMRKLVRSSKEAIVL